MEIPNGYLNINGELIKVYEPEPVTQQPATIISEVPDRGTTYTIDNQKFGIKNDGTSPKETTKGINDAITWAIANGYNHVYLTGGKYSVEVNLSDPAVAIDMQDNLHFEMSKSCTIELVGNSAPSYRIFNVFYKKNVKISGGKVVGDKNSHYYEISVGFVRGGVDANGQPNDNPNFIRSEIIDRYLNRGLLSNFRLWKMDKITAPKYSFFQYKDEVSSTGFKLSRLDGGFAPTSPTGRGWGGQIGDYNKMVFVIDITNSPLTDEEIAELTAKVDNMYYTHEGGYGVGIFASWFVEIDGVEISHCTGDGILTGIGAHYEDPSKYTYDDIGGNIIIQNCHIHHNRRQGISLCGPNDVTVYNNNIHHTGFADDDVTTDFRNGCAPMFGIDIESMVGEKPGFPYEHLQYERVGFQTNYRINIKDNYVHHNNRGHFVNCDGTFVTLENNTFEGWTVGHVSSYPNNWYVKYLDNTFISTDLIIAGNNQVNGAQIYKGNLRASDPRGAVVSNVQIREGTVMISSVYGYFGTPSVVDVATGTFTFAKDTGIGSGGQICFEQWLGKVPTGIDVNKTYWTVNATAKAFQVSETKGGAPVVITDVGTAGFNVSRFNYGTLNIQNVSVERGWRKDASIETGFSLLSVGGVVKNISIKNYDVDIKPPADYVGRPISVDGLTVIEGTANFQCCTLMNAEFMKAKAKRLGGDIAFGSTAAQYTRKVRVKNAHFENVDIVLEGNVLLDSATIINAGIGKSNSDTRVATVINSYIENSKLNFHWLSSPNQVVLTNNVLRATTKQLGAGVVFAQNTEIELL